MPHFRIKKINHRKTIGDQLKSARRHQQLTLEQVESRTHIRRTFLEALEQNNFGRLPAPVYTIGFLKRYAEILNLPVERVINQFRTEARVWQAIQKNHLLLHRPTKEPRVIITPKSMALAGGLLGLVGVTGYLWLQISQLAKPPELQIISPAPQVRIAERLIEVVGRASLGSTILINQEPVPQQDDGTFQALVKVEPGVNDLEVVAENRFKKITVKKIKVLRES